MWAACLITLLIAHIVVDTLVLTAYSDEICIWAEGCCGEPQGLSPLNELPPEVDPPHD